MNQPDYSVFASSEFDANDYANAVLAGEAYPHSTTAKPKPVKTSGFQPAKEDISVAISKLDYGIEDVSKQLKNVVTAHHEELLVRAAGVNDLQGSLTSVREGLNELDRSLEKLRVKIRLPYQTLQTNVVRLERLQQASDVLRRTSRFVILARRLDVQMAELMRTEAAAGTGAGTTEDAQKRANGAAASASLAVPAPAQAAQDDEKERTIAKAALSIAELMALLDASDDDPTDAAVTHDDTLNNMFGIPLRSIDVVATHVPFIENARVKVTSEMESMVLVGLTGLNQALLASSLQTAHNLRVLPELVQNLVVDLSEAVEGRIKRAFDLAQISKDAVPKEPTSSSQGLLYKSRVRTEPTNITAPQWTAALWNRLETMIEDMAGCCIKVYVLEKVLKLRKDPVSHVVFLDEAMKLLEDKPSLSFWRALARALEKQSKDSSKGSTFLQQTLSSGYPRLLRLFHDFFAKIALHTDTVYTATYQSPETVLVLRALSSFEALYLSKSSIRMNEAVAQAFVGGTRTPPGAGEGTAIARAVANELDTAKFDPLLVKAVARNAVASIEMLLARADVLVVRDRSAVTLLGPAATPQQVLNSQLATCMYHCRGRLEKLEGEFPPGVFAVLAPCIKSLERAQNKITEPLLTAIRKECSAIIARLHRVDFGRGADATGAGMGMGMGGGGPSPYMKDLVEKLGFVKSEILADFNVGDARRGWVAAIIRHVIRTFVLHVSIARPLGESGKLQLTSDMTELEFALSAFLADGTQGRGGRGAGLDIVVGEEYRTLRAMRPLLFTENALLASPTHTAGVPPLIVLHHILVRSPIPLPHTLHGWQEAEYVRWVDEHSPAEARTLVDGGIARWERVADEEGEGAAEKEREEAREYVRLARAVLQKAREAEGE